jgi:hypothetical protein
VSHPEVPDDYTRPPGDERASFTRAEFALMRRAARERWGVPTALQTEAIFQAAEILCGEFHSTRDKLSAMRFLIGADRSDVLAEHAAARTDLARRKLEGDKSGETIDCRYALLSEAEAIVDRNRNVHDSQHVPESPSPLPDGDAGKP